MMLYAMILLMANELLNSYFVQVTLISVNADDEPQQAAILNPEIDTSPPIPEYVWYLSSAVLLLIILGCTIKYSRDKRKLHKKTIIIQNPMVIPISIERLKNLRVDDLHGIRFDIQNTLYLFGDNGLNYDIYP